MKDTIHIALTIDDAYTRFCCVTLASVLANGGGDGICTHILSAGLADGNRRLISDLVAKFGQQVQFHQANADALAAMPDTQSSHISTSTYLRLMAAQLLPASLHKVIYLDCDLIVVKPLAPLWATDVDGVAVAAVEDMWSADPDIYSRLGYDDADGYFNAGVLLVNLDYWRANNVWQRTLDIVSSGMRIRFADQDILNVLFHDAMVWLPFRYNVQDGLMRRRLRVRPGSMAQALDERMRPAIIHFTGPKKPCKALCQNPYRELFFHYQKLTPWAGERPKMPLAIKAKLAFEAAAERTGLKGAYHCYVKVRPGEI